MVATIIKPVSILFFLCIIFSLTLYSRNENTKEIKLVTCQIDIESEGYIQLGESYQVEYFTSSCLEEDIAEVLWEPMNKVECDDELCLKPKLTTSVDQCFQMNVSWNDGTVSTDEICIILRSCTPIYSIDKISGISSNPIDTEADLALEVSMQQYAYIDLIKNGTVSNSLWEGWLNQGNVNRNLNFENIPAGEYMLRVKFYKEELTIPITKS